MAPPQYADLGKAAKDLFNKGYSKYTHLNLYLVLSSSIKPGGSYYTTFKTTARLSWTSRPRPRTALTSTSPASTTTTCKSRSARSRPSTTERTAVSRSSRSGTPTTF